MATLKKQALRIINDYKRKYGVDVVDLDEVALWAIREKNGLPNRLKLEDNVESFYLVHYVKSVLPIHKGEGFVNIMQ